MTSQYKKIQLEMALFVRDICATNDIKCYLLAGTALGAVRHSGFIPWDDDLDIGFLRKDYNKFIELVIPLLGEKYFLQTLCSDPNYSNIYAKLRANNTFYNENVRPKNGSNSGIFIDIFPMDPVPNGSVRRAIQKLSNAIVKYLLHGKCEMNLYEDSNSKFKRICYKLLILPIGSFFTKYMLINAHRFSMRLSGDSSEKVVVLGGSYGYDRESFPLEWLGSGESHDFEGHNFLIPKEWHKYLTNLYGNYMELPPVEQRFARHSHVGNDV